MSKSIDEQITLAIEKAVEKTVEKIAKRLDNEIGNIVKKHLGNIQSIQSANMSGDSLITVREASKILKVNPGKISELVSSGDILKVTPPGCRGKILRSSVDSYIKNLKGGKNF